MPNWSSANIAILGKEKELSEIADLINMMPSLPPTDGSGFGPFWLGKLVTVLGGNPDVTDSRGVISPNAWEPACMTCPNPDVNEKVELGKDGKIRFAIIMAWSLNKDILALLKKNYPSIEFRYKLTDEGGSFFIRNDPDDTIDSIAYHLYDGNEHHEYTREERENFISDLNALTGCSLSSGDSDATIEKTFSNWLDSLDDDDERGWSEIEIWRDVTA